MGLPTERTVDLLIDHRAAVAARRDDTGEYWIERDAVFPHASGDWTAPGNATWNIARLAERVGCPDVTAHTLHHFHATVLLQSGVNPAVVSQRLGHANVSITLNMYSHVLPGWQQIAADTFADAMDVPDDIGQTNHDEESLERNGRIYTTGVCDADSDASDYGRLRRALIEGCRR